MINFRKKPLGAAGEGFNFICYDLFLKNHVEYRQAPQNMKRRFHWKIPLL